MLVLPSLHAAAIMILTVTMFWMFVQGRLRIELICLGVIALLAVGFYFFPVDDGKHVTGMEIAFGGFGHEALVAICSLMILGRGLVVTGALEPVASLLARLWTFSTMLGLLCSLVLVALMSAVVNDTPILVLTMPILLNLASRVGVPASKTLMPMNAAILIGGMSTTVGTSTNLLVVSIAQDMGLPRFGVFQFTDIALVAGAIALPYIWLVMPRLLPARSADESRKRRNYDATLHVGPDSTLLGDNAAALQETGGDLIIAGVERFGRPVALVDTLAVQAGDRIHIEGTIEALQKISRETKSPLLHPAIQEIADTFSEGAQEDRILAELAIESDSPLVGQSIKSAQIADKYGVVIVGLHRPKQYLFEPRPHSLDDRLQSGDVLLAQGRLGQFHRIEQSEGVMLLEGAMEMPRTAKANLAIAIVAAAVGLAAAHLVPIAISALAGAIAMLATGCVKFERLGRALSAEVIILIAASIAIGRAWLDTGAADWMAGILAFGLHGFPPAAVLAVIMVFAAVLTNFASNTAAAAVGTPIAVTLAAQLGIPAQPLVLAVMFGCNLCFATPFAYQTNILIMSPGGYQFRDYVRAGTPLVVLMIIALSVLLSMRYGL